MADITKALNLDELASKEIVIADEIGCGLVPLDASEREKRERAGRLACMLAERADKVIRVVCGCPQVLKGAGGICEISGIFS